MRIETDGDLSAEEAAAVRAAVEQFALTANDRGSAAGEWTNNARRESIRGRPPRPGGRETWQAARDRRREARERAT